MTVAPILTVACLFIGLVSAAEDPTWCRFVGIAGCHDTTIKKQCKELCKLHIGCPESQGYTRLPGSQRCFKLFTDVDRDWYASMAKCRSEGLIMVKTSEAEAVIIRKDLVEKYGNAGAFAWLDAKYNGAQYVWNDGERIANDNALWYPGSSVHAVMPELKIDYCLLLLNADVFMNPKPLNPYWTTPCAESTHGRKAFCELLM